ncbi:hypothetical protein EDC04DRAFT_2635075 [Pisolithus marmoratus]|nr:hypothetical protein EDC04DRAFT_2635075 [Pisolithus marmoratus]
MQEGHLIPDPANIDYDNRSILGMLLPSTAKTKEVKMRPGAAKNASCTLLSFWLPTFPTCPLSEDGSRSGSLCSLCACYPKAALLLAPHCVPCVPTIQRQLSFWLPAFPAALVLVPRACCVPAIHSQLSYLVCRIPRVPAIPHWLPGSRHVFPRITCRVVHL